MSRFIIKPLKWTWTNSVGTPYDPPVHSNVPRIMDPDLPRVGEIFIDKLGNVYTHIIDNGVHKYVCMGDDSDYDVLTENGEYLKARGTLESYDKILGRATDIKDITSLDELYVAILKTGNTGRVEYKDFNGVLRKSELRLNFAFNAGSNAERIFMCRTAAGMGFLVKYSDNTLELFVLKTDTPESEEDEDMFTRSEKFHVLGRKANSILQISEEGVFLVIDNGALSLINLHEDIKTKVSISGASLSGYSFEHSIPKAVQEFCPVINGIEGKSTTYHAFSGNNVATISYNGSYYSYTIATIPNLSRAHSLGINSLVSVTQDQAVSVDGKQVGINLGSSASTGFIDDIDYQAYKKNDEELRNSKAFAIRNFGNKWYLVSVHEHLDNTLFSKLFENAAYYSEADFSKIYYLGEGYVASIKSGSILLYNVAFVDDAMHMTAAEMSMSEAQITSNDKEIYTSVKPSETVIKNNNSNITETVSGAKASTNVQSNNEKVEISADTTQNSSGVNVESQTKSYVHISEKDSSTEKAGTKIDIDGSTAENHKVTVESKSVNAKTGSDKLEITKDQVRKTDSYDGINSQTVEEWSTQKITETSNVTSDIEQKSVISRENSVDSITETKELKRKSSSVTEVSGSGNNYTINESKDIVANTGNGITHTIDTKEHIHTSGANDNNGQIHEVKLVSNGASGAGYVTEGIKNTSSNSTITDTVDVDKASEVKTYGTYNNGDKLKTEEKLYKDDSAYRITDKKIIAGASANDTIEVSYDRGNEKETMKLSNKKAEEKLESNGSYIDRVVDKTDSSNEKVYETLCYDSSSSIEAKSTIDNGVRTNTISNVNGTSSANMSVAKNGDYSFKMDKATNNHSYIQSNGNNVSVDFQSASGGSATLRVAESNTDSDDHSIQLDASSSYSRIFAKSDVVSGSGNYQTSFEAKSDANNNTITQSVDDDGSIAQTVRTASKVQVSDLLEFSSNDYAQTTVQANSVNETLSSKNGADIAKLMAGEDVGEYYRDTKSALILKSTYQESNVEKVLRATMSTSSDYGTFEFTLDRNFSSIYDYGNTIKLTSSNIDTVYRIGYNDTMVQVIEGSVNSSGAMHGIAYDFYNSLYNNVDSKGARSEYKNTNGSITIKSTSSDSDNRNRGSISIASNYNSGYAYSSIDIDAHSYRDGDPFEAQASIILRRYEKQSSTNLKNDYTEIFADHIGIGDAFGPSTTSWSPTGSYIFNQRILTEFSNRTASDFTFAASELTPGKGMFWAITSGPYRNYYKIVIDAKDVDRNFIKIPGIETGTFEGSTREMRAGQKNGVFVGTRNYELYSGYGDPELYYDGHTIIGEEGLSCWANNRLKNGTAECEVAIQGGDGIWLTGGSGVGSARTKLTPGALAVYNKGTANSDRRATDCTGQGFSFKNNADKFEEVSRASWASIIAATNSGITGSKGANNKFVYVQSGQVLACTANIGDAGNGVYIDNGEIKALSAPIDEIEYTVGGGNSSNYPQITGEHSESASEMNLGRYVPVTISINGVPKYSFLAPMLNIETESLLNSHIENMRVKRLFNSTSNDSAGSVFSYYKYKVSSGNYYASSDIGDLSPLAIAQMIFSKSPSYYRIRVIGYGIEAKYRDILLIPTKIISTPNNTALRYEVESWTNGLGIMTYSASDNYLLNALSNMTLMTKNTRALFQTGSTFFQFNNKNFDRLVICGGGFDGLQS